MCTFALTVLFFFFGGGGARRDDSEILHGDINGSFTCRTAFGRIALEHWTYSHVSVSQSSRPAKVPSEMDESPRTRCWAAVAHMPLLLDSCHVQPNRNSEPWHQGFRV